MQINHLNIKTSNQQGIELYFKIRNTTPLKYLLDAFCKHQGVSRHSTSFLFDGNRIDDTNDTQTPEQLGMEDGDVIDVMQPSLL